MPSANVRGEALGAAGAALGAAGGAGGGADAALGAPNHEGIAGAASGAVAALGAPKKLKKPPPPSPPFGSGARVAWKRCKLAKVLVMIGWLGVGRMQGAVAVLC